MDLAILGKTCFILSIHKANKDDSVNYGKWQPAALKNASLPHVLTLMAGSASISAPI